MTVTEEIAALQALHGSQGYLVIGSIEPLPAGPIDPRVWSKDDAYRAARWRVIGESTRERFEEQAWVVFGRTSGFGAAQYFYLVSALD
ncbi:MAG TPA: hypothetical protein VH325_19085 [Bryobacteraceae bacterium]|jgi:hypothetical protein|nr:hypothetical protein [Bryobacteraceae bacterium]